MAALIVISFQSNLYRASGVLDELRVLDEPWIPKLRDAVAIHRDLTGALKMDQRYQPTAHQGPGWPEALGFLIGATLALPIVAATESGIARKDSLGPAILAAARGARSAAHDPTFLNISLGIPENFVSRARTLIGPGDSAIFTLAASAELDVALARFLAYGGSVLQITLTSRQQEQIETALKSAR